MTLFSRCLWPETVRTPYRRMAIAMLAAPAILSVMLSLIAIGLAGLAERNGEEALAAGIDSAITLTTVVFLYTVTFGIGGICLLWSLAQRSSVAWASAGLVAGALGGFLLTEMAIDGPSRSMVIFVAAASVVLFLLIRGIAGIQEIDGEE